LLRLSLNVASTRVVLMEGHTGPDAAGKVIEAFGHFLVGGNFAVGVMVFIILVVINFMVITKGAGRIAEVGARFTLDAMPGKQMAIDADLNAGLIGEDVARQRRAEVAQEADFYGSMDGASKFVRGDAVAGLLILVINIVGGLIVGMAQHGLDFNSAVTTYTLLAIGDGLVAQIPALVISTAAGVIVSRVTTDEDVGGQLTGQLFSNPQVLFLTAGVIGLLGLIPGMPNLAFLLIAGGLVWLGRRHGAARGAAGGGRDRRAAADAPRRRRGAGGELGRRGAGRPAGPGSRLPADLAGGQTPERRAAGPHQEHAQEVRAGRRLPGAGGPHPRQPGAQAQRLRGEAQGRHGRRVARPGRTSTWPSTRARSAAELPGTVTRDPAFGLPAVWIDAGLREQAQVYGYTVVDASTVVATHLNHLMHRSTRRTAGPPGGAASCWIACRRMRPAWSKTWCPSCCRSPPCRRCCRTCWTKSVPIRDMRTILEALAEHAARERRERTDLADRGWRCRRAIVQHIFPGEGELQVIGLDSSLDRVLLQALSSGGGLEPGLADKLLREAEAGHASGSRSSGSRRCWWCSTRCACCSRASCAAACRS
jgi:flagellar biosynthesis protein FlhA